MTLLPKTLRNTHSSARSAARRLAGFRKDEDGGFIIFSLYLFIIMLMVGGLAVDFMRYEITRSRISSTLDRAILAAANLNQSSPPADVVQNYFDINGMSQFLNAPTNVTGGINSRTVNANASATVPMMFANMIGIDTMDTMVAATATESVEDIEISLVLDISGSMGWNSKLEELQAAAVDFIDIIYDDNEHDDISISIIPYSTQVSVGLDLLQHFNVNWAHDESTCVDFEATDFETPGISTTMSLTQAAHLDPWNVWGPLQDGGSRLNVCRDDPQSEILAITNVEQDLIDHINALTAGGNTSIEIGVKWGLALLHHDAQGAITNLVGSNTVPSEFNGRPYTTTSGASVKIMVVMTDGINTEEYRLTNWMRTNWSDARVDPQTGHYYVEAAESGDRDGDGDWNETWFVPHLAPSPANSWTAQGDYWRDNNDGVDGPNTTWMLNNGLWTEGDDDDDDLDGQYSDDDANIGDVDYDPNASNIEDRTMALSHFELYDRVGLRYNAYYHKYIRYMNADDAYDWGWTPWNNNSDVTTQINGTMKNARMEDICTEAKAYGVTIYTVGCEVTDDSAVVMEDCASSPAHFYRVAGEELGDAFRAIARQVTELRLIQ